MKRIYFIRHAPTVYNLSGQMTFGYNDVPILDMTDKEVRKWHEKVGKFIPKEDFRLYVSPAYSCLQTAERLFPDVDAIKLLEVDNFDCSHLLNKKFWEISQIEFESLISISPFDMARRAEEFFKVCELSVNTNIVVIGHGMMGKYLWHYMRGNKTISTYDIINGTCFKFFPLDMLTINLTLNQVNVCRS